MRGLWSDMSRFKFEWWVGLLREKRYLIGTWKTMLHFSCLFFPFLCGRTQDVVSLCLVACFHVALLMLVLPFSSSTHSAYKYTLPTNSCRKALLFHVLKI
jgi:hypothetical protein